MAAMSPKHPLHVRCDNADTAASARSENATKEPSGDTEHIYAGGEGFVWHPAIRALGWIKDWTIWAVFAGVLWECLASGLGPISPGSVLARTGAVCTLIVASEIPLELFQIWLRH